MVFTYLLRGYIRVQYVSFTCRLRVGQQNRSKMDAKLMQNENRMKVVTDAYEHSSCTNDTMNKFHTFYCFMVFIAYTI